MKSTILFLFVIIQFSCVRMLPDEELTMTRIPYTGKEFRIDGYYVGTTNYSGKYQKNYTHFMFFYSNGVVFSSYSYDINEKIPDINEIIADMERYRNSKDLWEVFQLENNVIHTQGWTNSGSMCCDRLYSLINSYFKIINDSTILFEKSTGYIIGNYNEYYHFKPFSPKPDSTNVFIK